MKQNKFFIGIGSLLLAGAMLSGCADDMRYSADDGEGTLVLRAKICSNLSKAKARSNVKARSTADNDSVHWKTDDELASSAIIWISNAKGPVRKYQGIDQVPVGGIQLLSDHYVAEAWAGDSVNASFTQRYFKGAEPFTITAGSAVQVNVTCKIANVVASVVYEPGVAEVLQDYSLTVGHSRGTLVFDNTSRRDIKGYFMMPSSDTDLTWTLTGTLKDGGSFTKTGTIAGVKPGTDYQITVKHGGAVDTPTGGAIIQVVVDPTEIEVEDVIEIRSAPQIKGYDFDITQPLVGEPGTQVHRALWILATSQLRNVVFSCPAFSSMFGISGNDFDLLTMTDEVKQKLETAGLTFKIDYQAAEDMAEMKVNFTPELMNAFPDGDNVIDIYAIDANGKRGTAQWHLVMSAANVMNVAPNPVDVWATKATISGKVMKDGQTGLGFLYRAAGTQQWQEIAGTPTSGDKTNLFTAQLTGLTPGTAYEYKAKCDGFESAMVESFTTESAAQLQNAGFESWNTSKAPYLVYGSGEEMYWDTGNHGSSTMSKNVTVPDGDVKHSGNYSAKLASQFVGIASIGKFAAGNIFIGKYLKTDGTDGILGWGRPFASRPAKLRGYIKYRPVAVTHDNKEYSLLKKGDMDQGMIYLAIVDGTTSSYNGESWPQIVKTKASQRQLFDKNGANVIAYGEKVFQGDTAGEDMIPFEITLDYAKTNVKAVNIILVAAASRGGDYFVGGNGSNMWLDDLELVYE